MNRRYIECYISTKIEKLISYLMEMNNYAGVLRQRALNMQISLHRLKDKSFNPLLSLQQLQIIQSQKVTVARELVNAIFRP